MEENKNGGLLQSLLFSGGGSGGGGSLTINLTYSDEQYHADCTREQLAAAIQSGGNIYIHDEAAGNLLATKNNINEEYVGVSAISFSLSPPSTLSVLSWYVYWEYNKGEWTGYAGNEEVLVT